MSRHRDASNASGTRSRSALIVLPASKYFHFGQTLLACVAGCALRKSIDSTRSQTLGGSTAPPRLPGRLEGDALIERKRLAGAGRSQEAGTAFGSRWTAPERQELQDLFDEHGRREAAVQFVEAHPHRTVEGALYQIDRNITKRAQ